MQNKIKIGLFDSGIGGFSILNELFKIFPQAEYFYFSDDAYAPYGPKADAEITERAFHISEELFKKNVDLIVVACNTATASSIEEMRSRYKNFPFVGVEPYLKAYYKLPEGEKKVVVLTTESTGKSERFRGLKNRLDPHAAIDHVSLKNLAKLIEYFYYHPSEKENFKKDLSLELSFLKKQKYTHIILGCTHYPLVAELMEQELGAQALSPCPYIASRVVELTRELLLEKNDTSISLNFYFYSSSNNQWQEKKRAEILLPFLN